MSAIAELAENRVVDGVYAVARKSKSSARGTAPRTSHWSSSDPTGRIEGRVWNDVELLDGRFAEGDAVRVLGRVERFRDRLQFEMRASRRPTPIRRRWRRGCDATRTSWTASSSSWWPSSPPRAA